MHPDHASSPRARRSRARLHFILLPAAAASALTACSPPPALTTVATSTSHTATAIAAAYLADLTLLRAHITAALTTQRTLALGRIHRDLIDSGFITPTLTADTQAFDVALNDPSATSALTAEIRLGRTTTEAAHTLLADYALALQLSNASSSDLTAALLSRLAPITTHDAAAEALLAAFDIHTTHITTLLAELDANTQAIAAFAAHDPLDPLTSRSLWQRIADHIPDSALRDAALDLIDAALPREPGA